MRFTKLCLYWKLIYLKMVSNFHFWFLWLSGYNMFVYTSLQIFSWRSCSMFMCYNIIWKVWNHYFFRFFWSGSFMFILTYQMVDYSFWGFINFYSFLSFFQLDHFLLYVMLFLAHSQWFCLFNEQDFRISVTCQFVDITYQLSFDYKINTLNHKCLVT